jgi:DNA-binding MarR family transcriptional regulator
MYQVSDISPRGFRALAEFRFQIRSFLHFSEEAAKEKGVEPQQHQAMLVIKAREPEPTSIRFLAERLQLRHHSAVGLVDRLESHGLVRRIRVASDRRSAQVRLTKHGAKILGELSLHHREELRSALPALIESLAAIRTGTERKHQHGKSAQGAGIGQSG